jgi:hypothetical protein
VSLETDPAKDAIVFRLGKVTVQGLTAMAALHTNRMYQFWYKSRACAVEADKVAEIVYKQISRQGIPDMYAADKLLTDNPNWASNVAQCELYDRWVIREAAMVQAITAMITASVMRVQADIKTVEETKKS